MYSLKDATNPFVTLPRTHLQAVRLDQITVLPEFAFFIQKNPLLGLELFVADTEFFPPVTHQDTQLANGQLADFMHANQ